MRRRKKGRARNASKNDVELGRGVQVLYGGTRVPPQPGDLVRITELGSQDPSVSP